MLRLNLNSQCRLNQQQLMYELMFAMLLLCKHLLGKLQLKFDQLNHLLPGRCKLQQFVECFVKLLLKALSKGGKSIHKSLSIHLKMKPAF